MDSIIVRFKARSVGKGYTQKKGVDYFEMFVPVVRHDLLQIIFALINITIWKFFNVMWKQHIYMVNWKKKFIWNILKDWKSRDLTQYYVYEKDCTV